VLPLGVPSLVNDVDPPYASKRLPPEETAVKVVADTPEPQLKTPEDTPHEPLDVVKVRPDDDPEIVIVARVCVDHVPAVRRPPTEEPEDVRAVIYALVGREVPVGDVVVVVVVLDLVVVVLDLVVVVVVIVVEAPLLAAYLIPLELHEPAAGAFTGIHTPSMTEPLRL